MLFVLLVLNVRVFAKAGNSLIVQPSTNAGLKNILLKLDTKVENGMSHGFCV